MERDHEDDIIERAIRSDLLTDEQKIAYLVRLFRKLKPTREQFVAAWLEAYPGTEPPPPPGED